jgi:hypothetical protein
MLDFSIRVRHAATSDDVEHASRWWTVLKRAAGKHRHSKAELYDCERMVFNPWNCLPEHRPAVGAMLRTPATGCQEKRTGRGVPSGPVTTKGDKSDGSQSGPRSEANQICSPKYYGSWTRADLRAPSHCGRAIGRQSAALVAKPTKRNSAAISRNRDRWSRSVPSPAEPVCLKRVELGIFPARNRGRSNGYARQDFRRRQSSP